MVELDADLALTELEARIAPRIQQHLRAQWQAHRTGVAPPPAPALARAGEAQALARLRAQLSDPREVARCRRLWAVAARAVVEASPEVASKRGPAGWGPLVELAEARNRAARALGCADFPALIADADGIELGLLTAPAGADPARKPELGRAAASPAIAASWLSDRGFETGRAHLEVGAAVSWRSFAVDPPRALYAAGPHPVTDGEWRAFVHELGHLWHGAALDPSEPWSARGAPSRVDAEAIADWVADIADSVRFAVEVLGLDAGDAEARAERRRRARRRYRLLQRARARLELELYRQPARDGAARWRELTDSVEEPPPPPLTDARMIREPGAHWIYAAADDRRRALLHGLGDPSELTAAEVAEVAQTLLRPGVGATWPTDRV